MIRWELTTAVTSEYDDAGFIGVQPAAFGTNGGKNSGIGFYQQVLPLGYYARPIDRDKSGIGSLMFTATEGGKGFSWCVSDPRTSKLPKISPGSRLWFADDGTYIRMEYSSHTTTINVEYGDGSDRRHVITIGKDGSGNPVILHKHGDGKSKIEISSEKIEVTSPTVHVNATNTLLGAAPGRAVACVGDLVAVAVPQLVATGPGVYPVTSVPPTLMTETGGISAIGQIISGEDSVRAGGGA